jgi:drug/metabolite transporter (DMT)-like permease
MYLLYCVLLVIWVPLLWPMFRQKGGARLWLLVVIAAGIFALIYEVRMFLWSSAAIRLDIPIISLALVCLYGSAAALLFIKHRRSAAGLLAAALVLIGAAIMRKLELRSLADLVRFAIRSNIISP